MPVKYRSRVEEQLQEIDLALTVTSFDRPGFLEECVTSLETIEDRDYLDWFFFQDGAHNPHSNKDRTQEYFIDECIDIARGSDIPWTDIRRSEYNKGAAIQKLDNFSLVEEGYDAVITVDGDMLVSKWLPRVAVSMIDHYGSDYISLYSQGPLNSIIDGDELKKVERGLYMGTDKNGNYHVNFPAAVITESLYKSILDELAKFEQIIEGYDWWPGWRPSEELEAEYGSAVTNAFDGAMVTMLSRTNCNAVQPKISRASHIGSYGMNVSEDTYDERFGDEGQLDYDWDEEPGEWNEV